MLTYKQIARKYGLSLSEISVAVNAYEVKCKGFDKNEAGRRVRTFDEVEVVKAVAGQMHKRADWCMKTALAFQREAERLEELLNDSN